MKARVKIITPWYGRPPRFYDKFRERVSASSVVEHELIPVSGKKQMNALAEKCSGLPCRKGTDYAACCDLKPLFGEMFADHFEGYEWWGRCDLDVVFGDLDRLLPPILDYYDGYSAEHYVLSGALTMFRNTADLRGLYRSYDRLAEVLADPEYTHFDHGCQVTVEEPEVDVVIDRFSEASGNPALYGEPRLEDRRLLGGFTGVVARSGLKMCWDDRSWDEGRSMTRWPDQPSRVPHLVGGRLIEMPTGREIVLYSIGSALWPLSDKRRDRFGSEVLS